MLSNIQLNNINLQTIFSLPVWQKIILIILLNLLIVLLIYCFYLHVEFNHFYNVCYKTKNLQQDFIQSHSIAAQLSLYNQKDQQLQQQFAILETSIDSEVNLTTIIDGIEKMVVMDGLQFKQIKPLPMIKQDDLMILPFQIVLLGQYHQFGRLMTQLANLDQLILIDNFILKNANSQADDKLEMNLEFQIYQKNAQENQ